MNRRELIRDVVGLVAGGVAAAVVPSQKAVVGQPKLRRIVIDIPNAAEWASANPLRGTGELKVFNRALRPSEIAEIYRCGNA